MLWFRETPAIPCSPETSDRSHFLSNKAFLQSEVSTFHQDCLRAGLREHRVAEATDAVRVRAHTQQALHKAAGAAKACANSQPH